jgi:hypothetical protein
LRLEDPYYPSVALRPHPGNPKAIGGFESRASFFSRSTNTVLDGRWGDMH